MASRTTTATAIAAVLMLLLQLKSVSASVEAVTGSRRCLPPNNSNTIPLSCQMLIKLSTAAASNLPVEFQTTWLSSMSSTSLDDSSSSLLKTHVCCRNAWFLAPGAMFHTRTVPSWPLQTAQLPLYYANHSILKLDAWQSPAWASPAFCCSRLYARATT